MVLVFIVAVASMLVLCQLLFLFFLKDYYINSKLNTLESGYHFANEEMVDRQALSQEEIEAFDNYYIPRRMTVLVLDRTLTGISQYVYSNEYNQVNFRQLFFSAQQYLEAATESEGFELLRSSEAGFAMFKMREPDSNVRWLDLFGVLENGNYVIIRTSYQSIEEAAAIASSFMTYVGLFVLCCGSVLVWCLSSIFTKPVKRMAMVAKRISMLDFDARYPAQYDDEIGVLGESVNRVAVQLEETIRELKDANAQLQKDIKNRERMDNMRSEFLSNVSHELKTPLALIQGYAEGLRENINEDPESRKFYCDVIVDEAEKMGRMVKKLLTLNQLESGKESVSYERFDVIEVLQGVIDNTRILREQQGILLHFPAYAPVYVWAEEYSIEEVITNYLSNAIHHCTKSKEIAVSMKKNGATVRISVYNTGETIPEADLNRIWDKFYKVDKARTREYGGSGIGLSIVKAIMDNHNQAYGVINHSGGVEFWFELELAKEVPGRNREAQYDSNH